MTSRGEARAARAPVGCLPSSLKLCDQRTVSLTRNLYHLAAVDGYIQDSPRSVPPAPLVSALRLVGTQLGDGILDELVVDHLRDVDSRRDVAPLEEPVL